MSGISIVLGLLIGLVLGGGGAAVWWRQVGQPNKEAQKALLESELNQARRDAEKEIEHLQRQAQQEVAQQKDQAEKEVEKRYADLARAEGKLDGIRTNQKEQRIELERRETRVNKRQSQLDKRENAIQKVEEERQAKLQEIAGLTRDEAKSELLAAVEQESRQDMARVMREIEEKAKEEAEGRARKYVATAIQRIAGNYVTETTSATVQIPSEEMKGRIIGRNGRNIRAFEQAAQVDIVVDDTPEAVSVSSFDPVRREVARRSLEKLVVDGRIHPARIEKLVHDAEKEVNKVIREAGETAAFEANVHGLHREVLNMLGRLKFRTSYGQNQLDHSVEASKIAAMLAAEMGADIELAKMGGLLHDLGKAMDHNQEGTHAMLGAQYAKRFKVPPKVVNAIAAHHHEVEQETVEAMIVEAADAISGARPGARRESLENYIKRVRTLEDIATSFDGVDHAYALQAGREIRVMVKPDKIDDYGAMKLSKDIARTIEDNMQYPGQIQVTIIRETRAQSHAK